MPEVLANGGSSPYKRLSIDVETRSAFDLVKGGAQAYARHPTTDCLCVSYAFDDLPPQRWVRGEPCPEDLATYLRDGDGPIAAFNAPFEMGIVNHVLGPKHGWPTPPLERYVCTAAMAAAMALPRKLGEVVKALGLEEEKDDAGRRIMLQLSKPRSKPGEPLRFWEPEDVPQKFERLYRYCDNDVVIERAAAQRMRPLSDEERELWLITCRMNERGLPIDMEAVKNALIVTNKAATALDRELGILTRNRVTAIGQVGRLKEWLQEQGVDVDSLDKAGVRAALSTVTDPLLRRVLEIRQEAAKSSTAKLKTFVLATCPDGRLRGSTRYHGASTGRDAGEIIQHQNFPRPTLKQKDIDAAIEAMKTHDPAWLELWGSPLDVVASCLRGMIKAPDSEQIYAGDLSNIEGRMAAWLAGEQRKIEAFRAFDEGRGPDLYKVAAAGVFGIPVEDIDDDDERRQLGKVNELSLQFQGGHGAFVTMGANYKVTPDMVAKVVRPTIDPERWAEVAERYDPKNRHELDEESWVALRIVIDAWRARHPAIVSAWGAYETAAVSAVANPGKTFRIPATQGYVGFAAISGFLVMRLPDGKLLYFAAPVLQEVETPWGAKKQGLTYMSLNSVTRRFERTKAYGGLIFQNAVQGAARQVIMKAQIRFERRGWPTIGRIHDELVCSLPADVNLGEFIAELSRCPIEYPGLPIAAKGARSLRYGK